MALSCDAAAILILRSVIRDGTIHGGDFQPYISPSGWHGHPFSGEGSTFFLALPHTYGSGFRENQIRQFRCFLIPAKNRQQHARTVLLHLHGHAKSVQRTLLEQTVYDITEDLWIQIVDIGFEHGDCVTGDFGRKFRMTFADGEPYYVRVSVKVTSPGTVAGLFNFHRGKWRESFCQCLDYGGASWRDQFELDSGRIHRRIFQQL